MGSIFEELKKLKENDLYPFHMPGHKRNKNATEMTGYMDIDITEIDGYDNLHDAEGIIFDAQERAKRLYGAQETFFLVNGSTSGVLSAVSAAVSEGGKLLAGRNSHKSLYHIAYLRRLEVQYLLPEIVKIPDGGILLGKINPNEVGKALSEDKKIEAVFITSPTYEGIASDIRTIADICHRHGKILIVDAAHGAHFGLYKDIPENAVSQGADIVIHSVHKTLASMTQTALIHVQGNLVDKKRLRRFLKIFQSSSPSYVLMASIDSCIADIEKNSKRIFSKLIRYKNDILEKTESCKNITVVNMDVIQDPCKVVVYARNGAITGQQLYDILRLEYGLQPEMAGDFYSLMIITGYDTEEGINRLITAIKDIDLQIEGREKVQVMNKYSKNDIKIPESAFLLCEAWDAMQEEIDISAASGRIAGEFINLYPPGIPIIAPGEVFTKEIIMNIGRYINEKMNIQGVDISENGARKVKVLKSTAEDGKNI
ncbi:aminotransferase class I/II-fold pyridoxal phosphate-dependent enzyme [Butyrivibrio sp. JL13D10]|uniref:aminotransferase class I/II-fold pyridoxal phosphate-dependent enzyme n=1 Tax=Butyrivibrio sp. JL13D10 TaxID=3236815 RepID=UPI0038B5E327